MRRHSASCVPRTASRRLKDESDAAMGADEKFARRTGTRNAHEPSARAVGHAASSPTNAAVSRSVAPTRAETAGRVTPGSKEKSSYHAVPVPRRTLPVARRVHPSGTFTVMTVSFQPNVPEPVRTTRLTTSLFFWSPTCTYQPAVPLTFSPRTLTRSVTSAPGTTVMSWREKLNQLSLASGSASARRARLPEATTLVSIARRCLASGMLRCQPAAVSAPPFSKPPLRSRAARSLKKSA